TGTRTLQLAACGVRSGQDPQQNHGGTYRQIRRYRATADGVKKLAAYTILREQVIKPLMGGATRPRRRRSKPIHLLDQHYLTLREELRKTFKTLGLAVA